MVSLGIIGQLSAGNVQRVRQHEFVQWAYAADIERQHHCPIVETTGERKLSVLDVILWRVTTVEDLSHVISPLYASVTADQPWA